MNKSAAAEGALDKPILIPSSEIRATSIMSSLSSGDFEDQLEESSWATYTDEVDRHQQFKRVIKVLGFDSSSKEEDATVLGTPWSASAEKLHNLYRKNMFDDIDRMIDKMNQKESSSSAVDDELEDTASSPHTSPTGKPAQFDDVNSNKECSELQKKGLGLVP